MLLLNSFPHRGERIVFHLSFIDFKSAQVSRTLLGILADHNTGLVWVVSIPPLISISSRTLPMPLRTVPSALISTGITAILMFHSFLCSLGMSEYLSFFRFLWFSRCGLLRHNENFSLLILQVPCGSVVKFQFLAEFPRDHRSQPFISRLIPICASFQHSLIMWLILSSLPQNSYLKPSDCFSSITKNILYKFVHKNDSTKKWN